jgi:hypothetical protein
MAAKAEAQQAVLVLTQLLTQVAVVAAVVTERALHITEVLAL